MVETFDPFFFEALFGSALWLPLIVFILTFIVEEVALGSAAYFVTTNQLSPYIGFISLYLGIFISDLGLFGLGVLARKVARLQKRFSIEAYEQKVSGWLNRNIFVIITAARLVPGLLIPTFILLGFQGYSLRKTAAVNLVITGLYSAVTLLLLISFGLKLTDLLNGSWWLAGGLALSVASIWWAISSWWRRQPRLREIISPEGLRYFPQMTLFERLPYSLVYLPVALKWLGLSIKYRSLSAPAYANPCIENGGLWGEAKSEVFALCQPEAARYLARFHVFKKESNTTKLMPLNDFIASGSYPVIAKPDLGYMSRGVALLIDDSDLMEFVENAPLGSSWIIQEYVVGPFEAGVFCTRDSQSRNGFKVEIAATFAPFVIGTGFQTVDELIGSQPRLRAYRSRFETHLLNRVPKAGETFVLTISGSTFDGCVHLDISDRLTPELEFIFSRICQSIRRFEIGRFDIRFESEDEFRKGEFKIIEINGAGGENLTGWDPRKSPKETYETLFRQLDQVFRIGSANQPKEGPRIKPTALFKAFLRQEIALSKICRRTDRTP